MAQIATTADTLTLTFSTAEKLAALRCGVTVARKNITAATLVDDGMQATHGMRAPGLAIPRRRRVGTWRRRSGSELVSVRRGQPALRIELRDERFRALVIGTDDAANLVSELQPGAARETVANS